MNNIEVKKCAAQIIDLLCDRNGFDDWWYNLDSDIENEIVSDMEDIIKKRFKKMNNGNQINK